MARKVMTIAIVAMLLFAGSPDPSPAGTEDALRGTEAVVAGTSYPAAEKRTLLQRTHETVDAGVSAEDVVIIVRGAAARGITAPELERMLERTGAVRREGLPAGPVVDIIQQGLAKGISGERILAAAERIIAALRAADAVVAKVEKKGGSAVSPEARLRVTQQVAGALQQGLSAADADAVGSTAAEAKAGLAPYGRAMEAVANLVELGLPRERAMAMAQRGLQLGYAEAGYAKMERRIMELKRAGMSWEESFREMNALMERGMRDSGRTTGPGGGWGLGPSSGGNGRTRMDRK